MNREQQQNTLLLTVCYLSQLVIGTAQPFGLRAELLLPVLAASTLVQLGLYRWLQSRRFFESRFWRGALTLFFCLMAGYDFIRADRFYRSVTDQQFSFWWLTACMLLLGWYAAACGRPAVQRAAMPVLTGLAVSLAVVALTGSPQTAALPAPTADDTDLVRLAQVFLQYTFGGEVLLWYHWGTHPAAAGTQKAPAGRHGWQGAVLTRFIVLSGFVVLAQLTLGHRFADTPQVFGVLSLVAGGAKTGHSGAVWHCVWLTALALRVCAICCTLKELVTGLLPRLSPRRRLLVTGATLALAALVWTALWQQDCLTALAAACAALVLAAAAQKKKGEAHAS